MDMSTYYKLKGMDLGATSDDQFRAMGFPRGRQDAIDYIAKMQQYDPAYQQQQAQQAYQQATNQAIQGLTTQLGNLAQQYSDLLNTVKGEYTPLINQTTATAGAAEAGRGISPDSQLYQQQVQGALQPVYGAQAANAQQIGQGSINDYNALTQAISNMQAGAAGTSATLPLNYGSLALSAAALPSQIGVNTAQASLYGNQLQNALNIARLQYGEPFNVQSGVVFNPSTNAFQFAKGGGGNDVIFSLAKKIVAKKDRPSNQLMQKYIQN